MDVETQCRAIPSLLSFFWLKSSLFEPASFEPVSSEPHVCSEEWAKKQFAVQHKPVCTAKRPTPLLPIAGWHEAPGAAIVHYKQIAIFCLFLFKINQHGFNKCMQTLRGTFLLQFEAAKRRGSTINNIASREKGVILALDMYSSLKWLLDHPIIIRGFFGRVRPPRPSRLPGMHLCVYIYIYIYMYISSIIYKYI